MQFHCCIPLIGNSAGTFDDLMCVKIPNIAAWPIFAADFIQLYDWDEIILSQSVNLSTSLNLCFGFIPCALTVYGHASGPVQLRANGSVHCYSSAGCTSVSFDSVTFVCSSEVFTTSVMRFQGSSLSLDNVSFVACSSLSDGGLIFAYDDASVNISACNFQNISSQGFGAVLKAAGSTVLAQGTSFENCSSGNGGGAMWATNYLCTGSEQMVTTVLQIDSSKFLGCSSVGSGGSILATSDSSSSNAVYINIRSSLFLQGSSTQNGGAIQATGNSVSIDILDSTFSTCSAVASGGAISIQNYAQIVILNSTFQSNVAVDLCGGALYSVQAEMTLVGVFTTGNTAMKGGGGALFWAGTVPPIIALWCPPGFWATTTSGCSTMFCPLSCNLCSKGKYQTGSGLLGIESCTDCLPGSFSNMVGSTSCSSCPSGTFSTAFAAVESDTCKKCDSGTFSTLFATKCTVCPDGTSVNISSSLSEMRSSLYCTNESYAVSTNHSQEESRCLYVDSFLDLNNSTILESSGEKRAKQRFSRGYFIKTAINFRCSRITQQQIHSKSGFFLRQHSAKRRLDSFAKVTLHTGVSADILRESQTQDGYSQFCGPGNYAFYGTCMASDFKALLVSHVPDLENPATAGLDFSFQAEKKDALNQTIMSDSSSVIQVVPISTSARDEPTFSLVGQSVFNLQEGKVMITVAIKPSFSAISFAKQVATISEEPAFTLVGADSQTVLTLGTIMQSSTFRVPLFNGSRVCPDGYVLTLDDRNILQGPAVCVYCKAGTYSLNPLAVPPDSASKTPSCLNCPLGGNCIHGGSVVTFSVGEWETTNSMYVLRRCPLGYRLVNSTDGTSTGIFSHDLQQCIACLPGQYIRPYSDICQTCPTGKIVFLWSVWKHLCFENRVYMSVIFFQAPLALMGPPLCQQSLKVFGYPRQPCMFSEAALLVTSSSTQRAAIRRECFLKRASSARPVRPGNTL